MTADAPTEATATEAEGTEQEQAPKPTETVDFWKQKAREQEKRAKENAEAARRLGEIEESQKSEAQKTSERLAEAEKKAADAEARVLRRDLAIEHKLSAGDAALLDLVTDETALKALAERLAGAATDTSKKTGSRDPFAGRTPPTAGGDPMREFARQLIKRD